MNRDEPWTFEVLDGEIDAVRDRILRHIKHLQRWFVGRDAEVELAAVCGCSQEPLLLVGPPGTAKSDLVLKFTESLGLGPDDYFEYMLTKFTEPSEVLGPIDIEALKGGRFKRRVEGMLPTATVVFLDEIFKSNSAILNTLLTVLNERKFYQDGEPVPVAMKLLFAATNDIPDQSELEALADRFVLKIESRPVKDTAFEALVAAGMKNEALRAVGARPWADGPATLTDLLKMKRYMDLSFADEGEHREKWCPPAVFAELRRVVRVLEAEDKVYVSDRKVVKLYKLVRTRAFLMHGGAVQHDDLRLLRYVGNKRQELTLVEDKVDRMLGLR